MAWLRDSWRISKHVKWINMDETEKKEKMRESSKPSVYTCRYDPLCVHPARDPQSVIWCRMFGQFVFGMWFYFVASRACIGFSKELFTLVLSRVLVVAATGATGVYLAGSGGKFKASFVFPSIDCGLLQEVSFVASLLLQEATLLRSCLRRSRSG
jgi:hypothetical protein